MSSFPPSWWRAAKTIKNVPQTSASTVQNTRIGGSEKRLVCSGSSSCAVATKAAARHRITPHQRIVCSFIRTMYLAVSHPAGTMIGDHGLSILPVFAVFVVLSGVVHQLAKCRVTSNAEMASIVGWLRFRLKYLTKLPARGGQWSGNFDHLTHTSNEIQSTFKSFLSPHRAADADLLPQNDRWSHVKLLRPAERVVALVAGVE